LELLTTLSNKYSKRKITTSRNLNYKNLIARTDNARKYQQKQKQQQKQNHHHYHHHEAL
jgi:hypothetical protein